MQHNYYQKFDEVFKFKKTVYALQCVNIYKGFVKQIIVYNQC